MAKKQARAYDNSFLPRGEPVSGKKYEADGWKFYNVPSLSYQALESFISIIGEDNIVWLSRTELDRSVRGQVYISPAGIKREESFCAKHSK